MRPISKSAIIAGAGIVLLGTGLALSSAGAVSGANVLRESGLDSDARKKCDTKNYCLSEINKSANGSGIYVSASGFAINSNSTNGFGIQATGFVGGAFEGSNTGLYSLSTGTPLIACGTPSTGCFYTDENGNGYFAGVVNATGFRQDVMMKDGIRAAASVPIAPRPTIEDTGTARMIDGVAVVHLESDFASTLDISQGYQVFLTPDGETRGWLYVGRKFEGGFVVREAQHGRSSTDFDYRVVAHPMGAGNRRFPKQLLPATAIQPNSP